MLGTPELNEGEYSQENSKSTSVKLAALLAIVLMSSGLYASRVCTNSIKMTRSQFQYLCKCALLWDYRNCRNTYILKWTKAMRLHTTCFILAGNYQPFQTFHEIFIETMATVHCETTTKEHSRHKHKTHDPEPGIQWTLEWVDQLWKIINLQSQVGLIPLALLRSVTFEYFGEVNQKLNRFWIFRCPNKKHHVL